MSDLEKIFNTLVLYHYNMRALHWKVRGLDFDDKHAIADSYIEKLNDYIDEVAEIMMMEDQTPKDLKTILDSIDEDDSERYLIVSCEGAAYYTNEQLFTAINTMFEHLINLYEIAIEDDSLSGDIVSKLQEHQYFFRLESKYKGKNRMLNATYD